MGVKYADDWIHRIKIENVTFLSKVNCSTLERNSVERGKELKKDAMLEKVILMIIAWYLSSISSPDKKDAESFLAKSVHLALVFLPAESPLVTHLTETYAKRFLQRKVTQLFPSPLKVSLNTNSLMATNIKSLL